MTDDADAQRDDYDDVTAAAVGKLTEAFETVERARGHLYSFHQLTGHADFLLDDAVDLLVAAGHADLAERVSTELIGRNVIQDRWTYQIVEDYNDCYYQPFRDLEREIRKALIGTARHVYEARLREQRRTPGHPQHTMGPDTH